MRDVVRDGAVHFRDRVALVDNDVVLTYRELYERTLRTAVAWRRLGVGAGDRVAILSGNSHRFFEWFFACAETGSIGAPLNFRLHPTELANYLRYVKPALFIVDGRFADLAAAALSQCDVPHVVGFGAGHPFPVDHDDLLARASPTPIGEARDPDAPAVISPTSGTTGVFKGAVLSQRNTFMACMAFLTGIGYTPTTRRLQSVQLSFATGGPHYAPLMLGASIHVVPRFEPHAFADAVECARITHTTLPPTMINDLLDARIDRTRLASLDVVNVGGSPFDTGRFLEAIDYFGPRLHVTYGLTESSACATMLRPSDYLDGDRPIAARLASVGRPWPGVRVRLVRDDGDSARPGEVAELEIAGPTVARGYWGMPSETSEAFHDGWFRTGDLAVCDDAGLITIVDRRKDVIVSGGINVSSLEVERVLVQHPGVARVAVIGVPDEQWGEAVKAVVVAQPVSTPSEAELIEWCRARLASFKKPRSVDFVDALPENANGKVLKRELRERYWAAEPRRVR